MIKHQWKTLLRHLSDASADSIDYVVAHRYASSRKSVDGARNQTIRRELTALRRGLKLAIRHGATFRMPQDWPELEADDINEQQAGKVHPLPIVAEWLASLADDARDEAWFAMLTGLRATEIKRVMPSWIVAAPSQSGVTAILQLPASGTKTRRARVVGLTEAAVGILERRASTITEGQPIFSQGSHATSYRAAARRIDYNKRITLRDLRATYASLAMANGADPIAVQAALGHSQLATTQRYLKTTLARTITASTAVAAALEEAKCHSGGVTVGGMSMGTLVESRKNKEESGGSWANRTPDQRIKSPLQSILEHVSTCFYCLQSIEACTSFQAFAGQECHTVGVTPVIDEGATC